MFINIRMRNHESLGRLLLDSHGDLISLMGFWLLKVLKTRSVFMTRFFHGLVAIPVKEEGRQASVHLCCCGEWSGDGVKRGTPETYSSLLHLSPNLVFLRDLSSQLWAIRELCWCTFHRAKVSSACLGDLVPRWAVLEKRVMLSNRHEIHLWQKANLQVYGVEWTSPVSNIFAVWNVLCKHQCI